MASFRAQRAGVDTVRTEALALAERVTGQPSKDVNYIIPRFVLDHLPIGLAGLFIAAVIAAAMNAICRRAQFVVDGERDRLLSPLGSSRGDRCAFPHRVARRDGLLGNLCLHRRDVRGRTSAR